MASEHDFPPPEDQDDDLSLFRESVDGVRPLQLERHANRDTSRPPPPPPLPAQRQRDEQQVMDELAHGEIDFSSIETGEEISHLKPGLQKRILQRLRRGHWRVQAELDLHDMNMAAANASIRALLDDALRESLSCIKIIHGKGLRSGPAGPQLKRLTASVLARHSRVLAFASAPPHDGGTGAVHVLLSQRR